MSNYEDLTAANLQQIQDIGTPEVIEADIERRIDALVDLATRQGTTRSAAQMYNVKPVPITIYGNHVEVKVGTLTKSISLFDFKTLLSEMLSSGAPANVEVSALPFNCYMYGKSATDISLGVYHPERIAELTHGNKKYKVPFPNTIISYRLKNNSGVWKVTDTRYFCTNKSVTQLSDKELVMTQNRSNGIWNMPFPNFYDDARMCYGSNTMPLNFTDNLRGLDYFYQVIFLSPFNNDLGIRNVAHRPTPEGWFKELSQLKAFPYDKLSEYRG